MGRRAITRVLLIVAAGGDLELARALSAAVSAVSNFFASWQGKQRPVVFAPGMYGSRRARNFFMLSSFF
jgi:hypothetical protein